MNWGDLTFMQKAIKEAVSSQSEDERDPKVGAVVAKDGKFVEGAHRGETGEGDHAEFAVLQKKTRSSDLLRGATLYTTLEPCTTRQHDKLPCVEWIVKKRIGRVVIGILDPNPNICGRGYWRLLDANVQVEFFSPELSRKIVDMNKAFIQLHRGGEQYDASFAWMVERHKSPVITPYPGIGWGDALSLQICPNLREGWPISQVELYHDNSRWFSVPGTYRKAYESYRKQNYMAKRFYDDGEKFMLRCNPTAFSDTPTLKLQTMRCRYSEAQYYLDNVATVAARLNPLNNELVKGSLEARFPHALCMHMVVVTADNKMLMTRRSPKVAWHPDTWSCSIEEQLARQDLTGGPNAAVQEWSKRMLFEELGIDSQAYNLDNLRVLSIFLEADILSIALCVYAEVNLDSTKLDAIVRGLPRTDYEFTEWDFLELSQTKLLSEMVRPTRSYHPTSRYRMLMALLKRFGVEELKKTLPRI